MYPDEIGSIPLEDHNATAPAPDGMGIPPTPEAAPVPPAPQYAYAPAPDSSAPQYDPAFQQPHYGPAPAPQYDPAPQQPQYNPTQAPQYTPAPHYGPAPGELPPDAKNLSIAGMVCSIVSFFTLPIVLAIVGLVLSIQGEKKTPEGMQNSYAKAGKILGIINIVLWGLIICGIIFFGIIFATRAGVSATTYQTF